ncbi:hypothetical protein [Streptomyces koyangensis]
MGHVVGKFQRAQTLDAAALGPSVVGSREMSAAKVADSSHKNLGNGAKK